MDAGGGEAVVALAGAADFHGGGLDIADFEGEAVFSPGKQSADRERVAEGSDREVGLIGAVQIGAMDAIDRPARSGALEGDARHAIWARLFDKKRKRAPIGGEAPDVIDAETAVFDTDHRCRDRNAVRARFEHEPFHAGEIDPAPEQDLGFRRRVHLSDPLANGRIGAGSWPGAPRNRRAPGQASSRRTAR